MHAVPVPVTLHVNGAEHPLRLEPRRTLLDALRDDLRLAGTKKVCAMGDGGACTVLVDGRAISSATRSRRRPPTRRSSPRTRCG